MRYASLKVNGCGSGVVEAANKVLVNQRMKRARWSIKGGQNVLTIVDAVGPFRTGMATGAANEDQVPDAIAA